MFFNLPDHDRYFGNFGWLDLSQTNTMHIAQCTFNEVEFPHKHVFPDKSQLNRSSAVVFHLPDLHWEGYNFPKYR